MKKKRLIIVLTLAVLISPITKASTKQQKPPVAEQSIESSSFIGWVTSLFN
jgi:hypothetical protein